MKILSIDTSSNICTISILDDTNLLKENTLDDTKNHSEKVLPLIAKTLEDVNLSLKDIDLLVCDRGPGSFTGIRIGTATVMSFTDSLQIPSIGISSLEALLYNTNSHEYEYICPIIDARNNNAYFAIYKFENFKPIFVENADCKNINEIIEIVSKYNNILFVGDGAISYESLLKQKLPNCAISDNNIISSYSLGLAGFYAFNSGRKDDILPLYLRKPQAERALENK